MTSGPEAECGGAEVVALPLATTAPSTATPNAGDPLPKKLVEGYIDGVNGCKVSGWAWCRSAPTFAVDVEIRVRNRVAIVARADMFRGDLAKARVGDGRHGFSVLLEEAVAPDDKASVTAFVVCDEEGGRVALVNRAAKSASPAAAAPAVDAQITPALLSFRKGIDEKLDTLGKSLLGAVTEKPDAAARERGEIATELKALREELARVASVTELLQLRVDAVHAAVGADAAGGRPANGRDRTLVAVVAALGVVSCAALAIGLASVLL